MESFQFVTLAREILSSLSIMIFISKMENIGSLFTRLARKSRAQVTTPWLFTLRRYLNKSVYIGYAMYMNVD